jgi:hypothetical protein
VARFFPDAERVTTARQHLSAGHYGDLDRVMGVDELTWPHTDDLPAVLAEFDVLANKLGLSDADDSFMVLVPVRVNGAVLTTPVMVDLQRQELSFTSHPAMGAGVIPDHVIAENTELASAVRERLIGVLATWHNPALGAEAH